MFTTIKCSENNAHYFSNSSGSLTPTREDVPNRHREPLYTNQISSIFRTAREKIKDPWN